MSLFRKRRSVLNLGIDLGASSLKAVLIEKSDQNNILKNYGYLKNNFVRKNEFTDQEITALLQNLLNKMKVSGQLYVAFALPVSQSFITEISIPPMTYEEIEKSIVFQAKQHIPVPLEEVFLSWQMIEHSKENSGQGTTQDQLLEDEKVIKASPSIVPKMKILLAAAPKSIVERYKAIAKSLNMSLKGLEIETFSLARSYISDNDPYLIVDIGAKNTNMTVVENQLLHLNRNLDLGGENFTLAIAKELNIEWERAEKIKNSQGLLAEGGERELTEVLYPIIDKIITEIDRVLSTYQLRENRDIRAIILSGGTAKLKGLGEYIGSKTGYPVTIGNPWQKVIYPENIENTLNEIGTSFAVAVGLALL